MTTIQFCEASSGARVVVTVYEIVFATLPNQTRMESRFHEGGVRERKWVRHTIDVERYKLVAFRDDRQELKCTLRFREWLRWDYSKAT